MKKKEVSKNEWGYYPGSVTPKDLHMDLPCPAMVNIEHYIQGHIMREGSPATYEKMKVNGRVKYEWVIHDPYGKTHTLWPEDSKVVWWKPGTTWADKEGDDNNDSERN